MHCETVKKGLISFYDINKVRDREPILNGNLKRISSSKRPGIVALVDDCTEENSANHGAGF